MNDRRGKATITRHAYARFIFYARVSTSDQTLRHQKTHAEAAGFEIDKVIADDGVSGVATTLKERPEGRRLFDILRAGDSLVVRWIDRLGRNYADVSDTLREFMRQGMIVRTVIHNMESNGATQDPMQHAVRDALIAFMSATAQAQAEATKEAQRAGMAHAHEEPEKYLGRRPSYSLEDLEQVKTMLASSVLIAEIGRRLELTRQTVYRIKADPDGAAENLATWDASEKEAKSELISVGRNAGFLSPFALGRPVIDKGRTNRSPFSLPRRFAVHAGSPKLGAIHMRERRPVLCIPRSPPWLRLIGRLRDHLGRITAPLVLADQSALFVVRRRIHAIEVPHAIFGRRKSVSPLVWQYQ